jgi:hypothetical protein
MALPPVSVGAVNVTDAEVALAIVAVPIVGAPGRVAIGICFHVELIYPSKRLKSLLYRKCPFTPVGRCAVVPIGGCMLPVPAPALPTSSCVLPTLPTPGAPVEFPVPPFAVGKIAPAGATRVVPLPHTPRSDGYVTKTSFVPALKLTSEPELLEDSTVVRDRVVPLAVYVPIPTSHSFTPCPAMV